MCYIPLVNIKIRSGDLRTRLCYDAKVRAKRLNLHFSLRPDQIHIPKYCPVLGLELKQSKGSPSDNSPTLDRINNDLGYAPWNVCVISYKANMLKKNGTLEDFKALVRYLEAKLPNVPEISEEALQILRDALPFQTSKSL